MADEYYDSKKEYYKRLERLARESSNPDGRQADEDREWIRDYKETESLNNMGGS